MGATEKSVMLPEHLWRALDDMSKDASAQSSALVRQAVEQFVALQGYEVPHQSRGLPSWVDKPMPPAPATAPEAPTDPGPTDTPAEPMKAVAAPSRAPTPKLRPAASPPSPNPTPAAPPPLMDEDDMGEAMTRVRAPSGQAPAFTAPDAPAATDAAPAHKPAVTVTDPPTLGGPEWVKRVALLDADPDRTAARERMQAIDNDVGRLTVERPTTTPLTEADDEDDEEPADA